MGTLPYVTAPGNIEKALVGIKSAATPPSVSQDFVKNILKIKGGSGDQMTSFLKKIGFARSDGVPTDIYKKFRNSGTSKRAAADALKFGYGSLYVRNEYMHTMSDDELKGLIIEETGQSDDSKVVGLVLSAIKAIKNHASWDAEDDAQELEDRFVEDQTSPMHITQGTSSAAKNNSVGLNLSYTINLVLPPVSDPAVFNAIFKSLKENLLTESYD